MASPEPPSTEDTVVPRSRASRGNSLGEKRPPEVVRTPVADESDGEEWSLLDALLGQKSASSGEAPAAPPVPGESRGKESAAPPPPPLVDGYRFVRRIGGGGSSDVHLYRQLSPPRPVAIKVLRRGIDARILDDEVGITSSITHPGIAHTLHSGRAADGRPYAVFDHGGVPLSERVQGGPLSARETVAIGVELGGILAAVHAQGILHGDIKPANVLCSEKSGSLTLIDFGSAATLASDPLARAVGYSVPWAPPEALSPTGRLSTRSDVYSFAATLLTLLTGQSPRPATLHPQQQLARAVVPDTVRQILHPALADDPADRPARMQDLVDVLTEISGMLPDDVAPPRDLGLDREDELWRRGQELLAASEWADALAVLDELVEMRSARGVPMPLATARLAQGRARARLGWFDAADEALREAARLSESDTVSTDASSVRWEQALLSAARNRHREAVHRFDDLLGLLPENDPHRPAIDVDRALSVRELGRFDESIAALSTARTRFATRREWADVARIDFELALTYRRMQHHERDARECLTKAARAYRRLGDSVGELRCQFESALSLVAIGRLAEAVDAYRGIRRAIDPAALADRAAECDLLTGDLLVRLGRLAEARTALESALVLSRRIDDGRGVADAERRIAVIDGLEGHRDAADRRFGRAFDLYMDLALVADAARSEIDRADMWARAATRREGVAAQRLRHRAADIAIPAALALDAGRYELRGTTDRLAWSENIAHEARITAFRLAFEVGDDRLLADLVLDARSVGTYAMADPSGTPLPTDDDQEPLEDATALALAASTAWRIVGDHGIRLGAAPAVVAPRGDFALRAALASAKSRFGVGVRSRTSIGV
ncbi:protein kinase domain-containing protein [Microbacterium sp. SLBN-146]|uniref:serine/threonine-protein kinase n=1 Tax=Microbacterium sp. SLBN-146 TaxID=2768457 RepID=UPI00114D8E11|nr:serine/threonine-protein kinase [Microbacterium sp. SLBN-146]